MNCVEPISLLSDLDSGAVSSQWPSGLERWTDDRAVLGSNPAAETLLRNFWQCRLPSFASVFLGGDTKSRRSILSGVFQGK